ncbi:pantoate--beta-alanine ligase [bacterium DOLZORAL124_64_63]|nr:MAG: pantoate--beta-alanine ligase [bacterium DOLZORAL124_64_63]
MELWQSRAELRALEDWRRQDSRRQGKLVLVPTMGALHDGHLSLVRAAANLGNVVVSIFVNPTQFGPGEDFEAYPRTLERDLELLSALPVVGVFAPPVQDIYSGTEEVTVLPGHRARGLCGGDRPGHFAGVLTVVNKLFNLLGPDIAVFGRKDAQQCLVIDQMVRDLKMPVRLVDVPTRREPDGLAMSSRNRYLSTEQRRQALCLHRALKAGRALLAEGCRDRAALMNTMGTELRAADSVEYAEVRQVPDLQAPDRVQGRVLLAVAARVGPARLIDNFVLSVPQTGGADITESYLLGTGEES